MVSRRPEAGSALGRGQRWEGWHSHCTSLLGQGVGTVVSSPRTQAGVSNPSRGPSPLSLLSDRTLACRCSATCRQTLSFWLAGWRCWRQSSGQVTLRHPHPLLCQPSLTFLFFTPSRKCWLNIWSFRFLIATCYWTAVWIVLVVTILWWQPDVSSKVQKS